MKKYLFVLVAAVIALVGCTEQQFIEDGSANKVPSANENGFVALIEQARWGDGQAFLKLADCYRDGIGVKKDFVGMLGMVSQADEFGSIRRMEDYVYELPEGSEFRMICDAIEKLDAKQFDEAESISEQLISIGSVDGYAMKGAVATERGDTLAGQRLVREAASHGSNLAKLLLCMSTWSGKRTLDVEKLKALSNEIPLINALLAQVYMGNYENQLDESQAAIYLLEADKHACLDRHGANWLLNHHRFVHKLPLTETDIQRLQKLASRPSLSSEIIGEPLDTVVAE